MKQNLMALVFFFFCLLHFPEAGEFKKELRNQYTGGLIGSAIGIGLGFGLASASQNDFEDLRKFLTFPLFGHAIGNSIGHFWMKREEDPLPLLISLFIGFGATLYLARDQGKHIDGEYYWFARKHGMGGVIAFDLSLALMQPLITTTTHVLCPTRTSVSVKKDAQNRVGVLVNQSF